MFLLLILAGFLTRVTRRISLVEQELATLPEHLRSPPVFSGVRFARSFVFCVLLDRCLVFFCPFSSGHCVFCLSSISRFLLPRWYLRILITRLVSQDSYYPVGISGFSLLGWYLRIRITRLVSPNLS